MKLHKAFKHLDKRVNRPIGGVFKSLFNSFLESFDTRVLETNWKQWRSDLGYIQEEDPGDTMLKSQSNSQPQGRSTPRWPRSVSTNVKVCPSFRGSVENKPTPGQDSGQRSSTTSAARVNREP